MPYDGTSVEVLKKRDLQEHKTDPRGGNDSTVTDPPTGVLSDDRKQVSLRHRHPDLRRLRASFRKLRRKSYKERSEEVNRMSKADHGSSKQGGGHIIPVSSLDVLDKELGRGEFGKVVQGIWTNTQGQKVQVAVKCLSPEKVSIDKHHQDFLKEAAIMYSLDHEHLVKLFGVVLDAESSLMLVTEFAPLRSLAENIKQLALKASFPVTLLVDFCVQVTDAMRYLHSLNIIHRDLSTRNILLFINEVGTKTVKISDFGLSRRLLLGENYRSEIGSHLPFAWMPVEALTKLTFTKASDVYSFGVTMWEMFSYGSQPWGTLPGEEILRAIDKPNLQRLARPEACPRSIYDIMLKCWAHAPDERPTFNEIHSELPQARPLQVRAVSSHVASSPDELTYRTDDIITVIESSDKSGMWTGINPLGKIGKFECTKTSATGSGPASPTRESRKGSKVKRAKSSKSKDKEVKKSPGSASAGIAKTDIGVPSNYQHIFHVGCDGQVEGDPTFGGTDYSTMPVNSIHVEKSPQTKRISRPTQLPPPPVPPPGVKAPTKASPERLEPLDTASQGNQREASPDILHGTSDRLGDRTESNHNDLVYQNGKDGPSTPDDEFSSFEMGSLLEECLSAWESVDTQLRMNDSLEAEESEGEAINKANANCTTNNSINQGRGRSREKAGGGRVGGGGGAAAAAATNDNASLSSPSGGIMANSPDRTLNLHNMIIKDRICTQSQTKRFGPVRRQDHQPDRRKAHTLGHMASSSFRGPLATPYTAPIVIPVTHPPSHSRTIDATQLPPDGGIRQEKRWRSEFKRLSSRAQETGDNDYLEGLDTPPPSPKGYPSDHIHMTGGPQQPQLPRREKSIKSSIKKGGYEELSKAFSPDPGTYFFHFADQKRGGSDKEGSVKENVAFFPRQNMQHSQDLPSEKGIVTVTSAENVVQSQTLPGRIESTTFAPAKNMQSSQISHSQVGTDLSPLGVNAYDMLVGGEISGSPKRSRAANRKKGPPAVPPKPKKLLSPSYGPKAGPSPQINASDMDSRMKPGFGESESRQKDGVVGLENVIEAPKTLEVPPLPPRDPVSPMHRVTSRLKSSLEGTPPRAIPTQGISKSSSDDGWAAPGRSPLQREENNNEGGLGDDEDGGVIHLSAENLKRLEQEERTRRRRRRRSRGRSSGSDSSDHSPVKTTAATSPRSPSPLSPQRLPNLPENDQTNRPQTLHIFPPLPPRTNPPPTSTRVGPSTFGMQPDQWVPNYMASTQSSTPKSSGARPKMRTGNWLQSASGEDPSPRTKPDQDSMTGLQLDEPSARRQMDSSGSSSALLRSVSDIGRTEYKPASHSSQHDPSEYQGDTISDSFTGSQFDPWVTGDTLGPAAPSLPSSVESKPGFFGDIPKIDILEDSTINLLSRLEPQVGEAGSTSSGLTNSSTRALQDRCNNNLPPLPPKSSPVHESHDTGSPSTSDSGIRTSTTTFQEAMKNLRTLSPRSSPRHEASSKNELPNCYAEADDGLDLPPPHVPIVQVKDRGNKPAVPPKPPPRGPYMKRSRTVDVPGISGTFGLADRKVKWGEKKANTVATDRDCAKRPPMKSAYFDKCIIDTEESPLQGNHRLLRGILEMQGHSFEELEEEVFDEEPDYPPPPVPLEEPTVMGEKHIAFRHELIPEPPSPMSAEDRLMVLKTLERQSSLPLSLTFEDNFTSERRHSCASSSSSATYISPRASLVGSKSNRVPTLNEVPTPINQVAMECQGGKEHYNTPRKIPEAELLKYNISHPPQDRVRFTRDAAARQSRVSDTVRELDYEIFVIKNSPKEGNVTDPTYEAMRSQLSLIDKIGYVNARSSSPTRTGGSASEAINGPLTTGDGSVKEKSDSDWGTLINPGGTAPVEVLQGYAVMTLRSGPRQQQTQDRQDVRRVRSMDDLLGSPGECGPSSADPDPAGPSAVTSDEAAAVGDPTRPPAPPPSIGHTFEVPAPGYVRMKGNTKPRSSSVCLLSKPEEG